MNVVYILGDVKYPEMIKIGYNSDWPTRFEQVRSHNPRGIVVHGIWVFNSKDEIKRVESRIHSCLIDYQRKNAHGREWFDISYPDALQKILAEGIVDSLPRQDPSPQIPPRDMPYDDWRHSTDVYKAEVYKRLLWVFQEDSPQKRIKVIHSPLFDTCYKYAFTYNPFPVYLVAAYCHPLRPKGPTMELRKGNEIVEACWEDIVSDKLYGPGLLATNVGWLKKDATMQWVNDQATCHGLVPYDLMQPKPRFVRPRDGQIKPIPAGDTWLKRVRPLQDFQ